ncbi:MAG: hypothetical protein IJD68_07940 [Ruminococcus sp.]|nr:hypothetical protein [Ruminococcus sp.]
MMLSEYLQNKHVSRKALELITKLKNYYEGDEEFIIGVLNDLDTDDEVQTLIEYIKSGEEVSYESIILFALDLSQNRSK